MKKQWNSTAKVKFSTYENIKRNCKKAIYKKDLCPLTRMANGKKLDWPMAETNKNKSTGPTFWDKFMMKHKKSR